MFSNQTIDKLEALGLSAMAAGLAEQLSAPGTYDELSFADRLGLLVDKEADARDSRRLAERLKAAKLRHPATVEDIDFQGPEGAGPLRHIGPGPGVLGERAPQRAHHRPHRVRQELLGLRLGSLRCPPRAHGSICTRPRLLDDLALGRADGRYTRTLSQLARVDLLVLDDFLLTPAPVEACRDLLEVIEDRTGLRATVVASQLPVDKWHPSMADPTLADAVLDRLCQAAHRIALRGASMRKRQPPTTEEVNNA